MKQKNTIPVDYLREVQYLRSSGEQLAIHRLKLQQKRSEYQSYSYDTRTNELRSEYTYTLAAYINSRKNAVRYINYLRESAAYLNADLLNQIFSEGETISTEIARMKSLFSLADKLVIATYHVNDNFRLMDEGEKTFTEMRNKRGKLTSFKNGDYSKLRINTLVNLINAKETTGISRTV